MCLLFSGTSSAIRAAFLDTPGMVADVYAHNQDGLGFMYATASGLKVVKKLPKSAADVRKMIEALPKDEREVAGHFRMRTHGDIDKANCHPYAIGETGAYLMHNGILDTGNKADTSKSDTWHFAKNYLATLDADVLHNEQYRRLLGEFIGPNRFVIATPDGRMSWVNAHQGVEAAGVVFSNTYAWSPELLIPEYRSPRLSAWAGSANWDNARTAWKDSDRQVPSGWPPIDTTYDEEEDSYLESAGYTRMEVAIMQAIDDSDAADLAGLIERDADTAVDILLNDYYIEPYLPRGREFPTSQEQAMWVDRDAFALTRLDPKTAAYALINECEVSYTYSA